MAIIKVDQSYIFYIRWKRLEKITVARSDVEFLNSGMFAKLALETRFIEKWAYFKVKPAKVGSLIFSSYNHQNKLNYIHVIWMKQVKTLSSHRVLKHLKHAVE